MKWSIEMHLIVLIVVIVVTFAQFAYTKPMESIEDYNIILVHGAADSESGMKCSEETFQEPFDAENDSDGYLARLGGGTGLIKELRPWLSERLFDSDKNIVYLQRPFTNPASSPDINARELGDPKWPKDSDHSSDGCSIRRSLIEEAKEVRAKGRSKLLQTRTDPREYRKMPSRNILIAHSMGGVISREYVQGDFSQNDVDKVITLDSPHMGTHSLDGLLDLKKWIQNPIKETFTQEVTLGIAWGLGAIALNGGPVVDEVALELMMSGIASANAGNAVLSCLTDLALGYDYIESDPLVSYIRPGSGKLSKLNKRLYNDSLPMFRILSGVGGVTVGSNLEYGQSIASIFVPDALFVPIKNVVAQMSHTEISNPTYLSNIIGSATLGTAVGLSLTDQGTVLIPHWSGNAENVLALQNKVLPSYLWVAFSYKAA